MCEELFDVREGEVELEVVLQHGEYVEFQRHCLIVDAVIDFFEGQLWLGILGVE